MAEPEVEPETATESKQVDQTEAEPDVEPEVKEAPVSSDDPPAGAETSNEKDQPAEQLDAAASGDATEN